MSVTAGDILACAKALAQQPRMSEAHARAVIGRAYYATYHDCCNWHAALPAPGRFPIDYKGGGWHEDIIAQLANPDPSIPQAQQKASRERSARLRALRSQRTLADYSLNESVDDADARTAVAEAVSIIRIA